MRRVGVLVFGVGGLQHEASHKLCLQFQQSVRPQCLPLHKTMGGGAGLWPEGRDNRPLCPAEKKERESGFRDALNLNPHTQNWKLALKT